jgi:16S rRNA C967 or C1407 C5-methylase (RsmB/RsmF family)
MGARHHGNRPREAAGMPGEWLLRLSRTMAADERHAFVEALDAPPPVSIRLNPAKPAPVTGEPVPWCAHGRWLGERPAFTFDPLLHAGAYYVQEASSMLLQQAVVACTLPDAPLLALDLCAAPGGKCTHLLTLLPQGSLLVANEMNGHRRSILLENLWKWGWPGVAVAGSAPQDFARTAGLFDLVLVDAPCSGEGMMRKDPHARAQWSPTLAAHCATVQQGILGHAWAALKPGGHLIYSTCTWEPGENEDQLARLVATGAVAVEVAMDERWGVVRTEREGAIGYRCYPHRVRGEGFFLGVVRKPGERRPSLHRPACGLVGKRGDVEAVQAWLQEAACLMEHGGVLHAIHPAWHGAMLHGLAALRIVAPGIPVAEPKGNGWRPHAALALNRILQRGAFPEVEMDHRTAIAYLRGGSLPAAGAAGHALAMYRGHPLGWLQGAGTRWNNRWPVPWRIRAQQARGPDVSWA